MEVTLATKAPVRPRLAAVAGGCALAGAAALVALHDPAAPGSRFPACVFHSATGLWCPGCGLTRGVHQLLTGHPLAAMGENLFVPLVVLAVAVGWLDWARRAWGRAPLRLPWHHPGFTTRLVPAVLAVFTVARNLPVAGLRALAP